jgi:hypothetical protein
VALRNRVRQLERAARDNLDWFELEDGTRFYFDPQKMPGELFDHGSECLKADFKREIRPSPPAILWRSPRHAIEKRLSRCFG